MIYKCVDLPLNFQYLRGVRVKQMVGRVYSNCNIFTLNIERTLGDASDRDDKILKYTSVA